MTHHEHNVLTGNYDSRGSIVVSWGYANRNQANGVDGKCVEHWPTSDRLFGVYGDVQPSRHPGRDGRVAHLPTGEGLSGVERDGAE